MQGPLGDEDLPKAEGADRGDQEKPERRCSQCIREGPLDRRAVGPSCSRRLGRRFGLLRRQAIRVLAQVRRPVAHCEDGHDRPDQRRDPGDGPADPPVSSSAQDGCADDLGREEATNGPAPQHQAQCQSATGVEPEDDHGLDGNECGGSRDQAEKNAQRDVGRVAVTDQRHREVDRGHADPPDEERDPDTQTTNHPSCEGRGDTGEQHDRRVAHHDVSPRPARLFDHEGIQHGRAVEDEADGDRVDDPEEEEQPPPVKARPRFSSFHGSAFLRAGARSRQGQRLQPYRQSADPGTLGEWMRQTGHRKAERAFLPKLAGANIIGHTQKPIRRPNAGHTCRTPRRIRDFHAVR